MANEKKQYLNNKEFTAEIISCKKSGNLSPRAVEMFQRLCDRVSRKLQYRDPRDKEDCMQSALYDLCKYWRNFDEEKSMNAFAFFTSIAVHGFAKEFKKIHKGRIETISLDQFGADGEIYTV